MKYLGTTKSIGAYQAVGRPANSIIGRTSTVPLRAGGTRAAMLIASRESLAELWQILLEGVKTHGGGAAGMRAVN
jgi:hypothetical protein